MQRCLLAAAKCIAEEDSTSLIKAVACASMQHALPGRDRRKCRNLHLQLYELSCNVQAILEQESRIAGFKGEVAKSQELHLASLSRDTERLTNSLEKMRAEIK